MPFNERNLLTCNYFHSMFEIFEFSCSLKFNYIFFATDISEKKQLTTFKNIPLKRVLGSFIYFILLNPFKKTYNNVTFSNRPKKRHRDLRRNDSGKGKIHFREP